MNCSHARVFPLALFSITFVYILASTGLACAQIVAFGHSAARGHVEENEMWPEVLESMLRAKGRDAHVINAGVNGETTAQGLARLDSAIPTGTKIVILTYNGFNDARKLIDGKVHAAANIAAMKNKIRARGVRLIDAMPMYTALWMHKELVLPDGHHLNVEGNRRLAAMLARML